MAVRRSSGLASVLGWFVGVSALLVSALPGGCSAGDSAGTGVDSDGDGIPDVDDDDNGAGAGSNGGLNGVGNNGSGGGGPGSGNYCDEVAIDFVARTPTVMVLVDRSGTIYDLNLWAPLREGVLPVILGLQEKVRFSFGTYTATSAAQCTAPSSVVESLGLPALNNYQAIADYYTGLGDQKPTGKLETPTSVAIAEASAELLADTEAPGSRFILLVTGDDDPDFCGDQAEQCGADATVAAIQTARAQGVGTLVFAINNANVQNPDWFHYYAQAGAGQQPNWPQALTVTMYNGNMWDACNGIVNWTEARTANGVTQAFYPAGVYSTEGGTAQAFLNNDVAGTVAQIETAVQGLKSCVLDLANSGVEVTPAGEESGEIFIENVLIPLDQWHMNSPTVLELTGDACATWQLPESNDFFAGLTCEQIIIR